MLPHSDSSFQSTQRRSWIIHGYRIFLFLTLFVTGVAAGLLVGRLVFNEGSGDQPSANWGGTVTQGGVEKPVLEAIADMMNAENIKENLR